MGPEEPEIQQQTPELEEAVHKQVTEHKDFVSRSWSFIDLQFRTPESHSIPLPHVHLQNLGGHKDLSQDRKTSD